MRRERVAMPPRRLRKVLVEFSVVARELEFSFSAAPGRIVDLDQRLASGVTLADVTKPEWFGPIEEVAAEDKKETDDDGA